MIDLNQLFDGVINVPLIEDQLALRVAAYHHDNAGYIDAINTPTAQSVATISGSPVFVKDDVNSSTTSGGRATLLWRPREN